MNQISRKCGYVALMGCPNAGKSTLMNACLETKIAGVSQKPQTTRHKILGICQQNEAQILFLDTPGIHNDKGMPRMNKIMNHIAWSVVSEADVICYLIDLTAGFTENDHIWLKAICQKTPKKILLLATKSDKLKKVFHEAQLETFSQGLKKLHEEIKTEEKTFENFLNERFLLPIPRLVSAKIKQEVLDLRAYIAEQLAPGEWLYNEEELTDRPQKFICAELIREQLFRQLGAEIPYKVSVVVDVFQHKPQLTEILSTVYVERDSQKSIIIGKGGSKIKNIGTDARASLEKHLGRPVFLKLFVKVKKGWTEDVNLLSDLAYLQDPSSL